MKKTKKLKNFDKKEQRKVKKERGITLIALVITIIVLLILAAVSIATLTGENGILTKANKAREETETASEEEQRELAMIEANMNDEETEFQGVKIPAGFAPTKIEGESTIDEGLVMVDSEGNSYVWIEVPKTEEVYKTATTNIAEFEESDYTKIYNDLKLYTEQYSKGKLGQGREWKDTWHDKCGIETEIKYNELKNKMLKSVYENGGFWIGQYEVGYEQGVDKNYRSYEAKDEEYFKEHPIKEIPVCKEGAYPYNWVTCSQAQELASKMITSENYTSSLMFGIQWDLVMKYIETKKVKTIEQLNSNSSSWGNYKNVTFTITKGKYSEDNGKNFQDVKREYTKPAITEQEKNGVLLTTGATERNSALNIYDIAGNVYEWTLEKTTDETKKTCSMRGDYYNGGTGCSASYREFRRHYKQQ